MMKTSDWMIMIKNITLELDQLRKEEKQILKMNSKYRSSLGIDDGMDAFEWSEEYDEVQKSFPMNYAASQQRNSRLTEIQQRRDILQKQFFAIKCVALSKATKLSKGAKAAGFLDNKAYLETLIAQSNYTYDELIVFLNQYFQEDNFSFDHFVMSSSEADRITRKGR